MIAIGLNQQAPRLDGVVSVFVRHFSYSTLFTIRTSGWGPGDVCNNEGPARGPTPTTIVARRGVFTENTRERQSFGRCNPWAVERAPSGLKPATLTLLPPRGPGHRLNRDPAHAAP